MNRHGVIAAGERDPIIPAGTVPTAWEYTGAVSQNLLVRAQFAAKVIVVSSLARALDVAEGKNPLDADAADKAMKNHISNMAEAKGLPVPQDFVDAPENLTASQI